MALNGYIFDERDNSAKNWRAIFAQILPDGYLDGCNLTYTATNITIGRGRFIAGGGAVEVDGDQTIPIGTPTVTNGYVQLKFTIDLSNPAQSDTFTQGDVSLVYSTTQVFPDLIQEAINVSGNIYEMEMGVFRIEGGNLTQKISQMAYAGGFLQLAGGEMTGPIAISGKELLNIAEYGTENKIQAIWYSDSSDSTLYLGGGAQAQDATVGDICFRVDDGGTLTVKRGSAAAVDLFDAGNFTPGTCSGSTQNQYSAGTHTHDLEITNTIATAYNGTLYLGYSTQENQARLAGYFDEVNQKDYAQIAIVAKESGAKGNAVNVYWDNVTVEKDLQVDGNINAMASLNLYGDESRLNGKNYAGDTIRLLRSGINEVDNLWIGTADFPAESKSHAGNTYLSAGRGGHIYAVIKKLNADGDSYEILHMGNAANLLKSTFAAASHTHYGVDRPETDDRVGIAGNGMSFMTYTCDWTYKDNRMSLGLANCRWKQLYAATSAISTSDARVKEDIADIANAKELILNLKPRQFKLTEGESGRTHYGLIAQEVKEAMTAAGIEDFGGYIRGTLVDGTDPKTAPEDQVRYALRYEEFIAPLIATVQQQQEQIAALEERIAALEEAK